MVNLALTIEVLPKHQSLTPMSSTWWHHSLVYTEVNRLQACKTNFPLLIVWLYLMSLTWGCLILNAEIQCGYLSLHWLVSFWVQGVTNQVINCGGTIDSEPAMAKERVKPPGRQQRGLKEQWWFSYTTRRGKKHTTWKAMAVVAGYSHKKVWTDDLQAVANYLWMFLALKYLWGCHKLAGKVALSTISESLGMFGSGWVLNEGKVLGYGISCFVYATQEWSSTLGIAA